MCKNAQKECMFYENLKKACSQKGISVTVLCGELGFSSGNMSRWKKGSAPGSKSISKIAEYLGVSVDSLLYDDHETVDTFAGFDKQKMRPVPLYESVSAGFGVYAVDSVVGFVPMAFSSEAEAQETIAIKVQGDSMYPKIEDGDTIIVHKQTSVDSGSVAVVLLDGEEGLVKKVVYGADWIELHSFNPMYPTRRFEGPEVLRLQVVGLVKQVIKEM